MLARRKIAMVAKTKLNRDDPGWRDVLFSQYPELECPSAEEEDGGDVVAVEMKRRSTLPSGGIPKKMKTEPSAALGRNPDDDQPTGVYSGVHEPVAEMSQGTAGAQHNDSPDSDDCILVDVVQPTPQIQLQPVPDGDRMVVMESMVKEMNHELQTLRQANQLREQQEEIQEDEEVKTRLSSLEKRAIYLNMLREVTPNLNFPDLPVDDPDKDRHFGGFVARPDKCVMPFCDELLKQVSIKSRPSLSAATKREPFRLIDKFYKTVATVEQALLKPRIVPAALLHEVPAESVSSDGASGAEARLKSEKANGQKEADALRDCKQASSLMRVVNSQELGLQALAELSRKLNSSLESLSAAQNVPLHFTQKFSAMSVCMENMAKTLDDMKLGNLSLAKACIHQYVESIKDRRDAWVSSSRLPKGLQKEITKAPLDILQPGADEPLMLIDSRSVQLIEDYNTKKDKDAVRLAVAGKTQQPRPGGNKRKRKRPGNNQRPMDWNDMSQAAKAAGWSSSQKQHTSRGGRGGRGGRGRGRGQPFSASTASESSK
jgi:hypothetical protein